MEAAFRATALSMAMSHLAHTKTIRPFVIGRVHATAQEWHEYCLNHDPPFTELFGIVGLDARNDNEPGMPVILRDRENNPIKTVHFNWDHVEQLGASVNFGAVDFCLALFFNDIVMHTMFRVRLQ